MENKRNEWEGVSAQPHRECESGLNWINKVQANNMEERRHSCYPGQPGPAGSSGQMPGFGHSICVFLEKQEPGLSFPAYSLGRPTWLSSSPCAGLRRGQLPLHHQGDHRPHGQLHVPRLRPRGALPDPRPAGEWLVNGSMHVIPSKCSPNAAHGNLPHSCILKDVSESKIAHLSHK